MTFKAVIALVATLLFVLFLTTSCSSSEVCHAPGWGIGHGPPAHAPAYGHRRKQVAGVQLVFDSGRGVYVVVGHPDHYYYDGYFYRRTGTVWQMSLKFDSGWAYLSGKPLPPGLQAKTKGKSRGKANAVAKGKHSR